MRISKWIVGMLACWLIGIGSHVQGQSLSVSPSVIPGGHSGNITLTVTLVPGGADTTLVGQDFTLVNNTTGLNHSAATKVGAATIVDATHATIVVTTTAGGGPFTLTDTNGTVLTVNQRIPVLRTSPTWVPANATTLVTVNTLNTLSQTDNSQLTLAGVAGASAGATTWTSQTQGSLSITTGATTGNLTLTDPSTGLTTKIVVGAPTLRVYIPYFTVLTGLTTPTGLTIASNGGLVATTNGTAGTATIPLGAYIDLNKPYRVAVLVEYNGDTTNNVTVKIPTTGSNSNQSSFGVGVSAGYISPGIQGSSTMLMTSGQRYWMYAASAGAAQDGTLGTTTQGVCPQNLAGLSNAIVGPATQQLDYWTNVLSTFTVQNSNNFEVAPLFGMGTVTISTASGGATATRILGLLVQQESLAGGNDPQCLPPAKFNIISNGDTTTVVRLPPQYDGTTPTPLFVFTHPNNSSEDAGIRYNDPDGGQALALVSRAGYITIWGRNTTNYTGTTYSAPPASGWGSAAQLLFLKAEMDWCKTNLSVSKIFALGQSMGLVTILRYHMTYPTYLSGIFGICGVANLTYAYSNEGFNGIIDSAYGTTGNFVSGGSNATYDPNLNISSFVGSHFIPMLLTYGTADTTVHPANHSLLFATNVNAAGGSVTTVAIPGAQHLDKPALYDGLAIQKFLQSLQSARPGRRPIQ